MAKIHVEILHDVLKRMTDGEYHYSRYICDNVKGACFGIDDRRLHGTEIIDWINDAIEENFSYACWLVNLDVHLDEDELKAARIRLVKWMIKNDYVFDEPFRVRANRDFVTQSLLRCAGIRATLKSS